MDCVYNWYNLFTDSCPECIASRQKELQENLLSYTNATIYIRRVAENKLTKALDRLSPTPSTGSDIDSGNVRYNDIYLKFNTKKSSMAM